MSEAAVVCEGLLRRFGATTAVDGLSLEVRRGEVLGLLGHNGAGKTTTVRLLNGVLARDGGAVRVLGLDPEEQGEAVRARTGVLTESPAVDERFTARENLAFFAKLHGMAPAVAAAAIDALLNDMDLARVGDARVATYSKGMKQKLAIARALLHDPEVLYLDEPTSGLDPAAARDIVARVRRLARERGRAVVFCTHRLKEAEDVCDRVAVLARGKLVAIGTPAELAARLAPPPPRVVVEVDGADAAAARAALAPSFAAVADGPTAGVLVVDEVAHERVPALVAALCGAGVRVHRVEPARASLEDVYFKLDGAAAATGVA